MPQVSLVAVRPVESHTFSTRHLCFPNIRTDWWLWSYALHDFTSRWSSLKDGLQQSSWKVSQTLMKRVKHVVALRASLAMWENSELACLNHSVRSVASGPSKLHTTMFPQHALRMTSCHAGFLQCWFETQLWEQFWNILETFNVVSHFGNFVHGLFRCCPKEWCANQSSELDDCTKAWEKRPCSAGFKAYACKQIMEKALVKDDLKLTNALVVVLLKTSLQTTPG